MGVLVDLLFAVCLIAGLGLLILSLYVLPLPDWHPRRFSGRSWQMWPFYAEMKETHPRCSLWGRILTYIFSAAFVVLLVVTLLA